MTMLNKVSCHNCSGPLIFKHHDDKILVKMFSLTGGPMAPFGPGVPG